MRYYNEESSVTPLLSGLKLWNNPVLLFYDKITYLRQNLSY